ncbi:uncharacterized protein LOC116307052 [Actinia tenebrosa]|uniref:Uncharacterized protein LOC116307052 n=1 Tax=Actinia tenebrosa TaxID=6105 RepID=A0A6P8J7B8_ACTTE|nr:uncharacterized protein LOC116307052 [Actinia tenebrosa]XP_031573051.1 uncharacterized protein LOC116307052 [Actinia tenebrosa]
MSSKQGYLTDLYLRKKRERRLQRRRAEQTRKREARSEHIDPRRSTMQLRRTHQRTKRDWRGINQNCLRLIEDCQQIIQRIQSNENHFNNDSVDSANLLTSSINFINHDNLLQISPEMQPESSFGNMLKNLNGDEHYQPPFITSQTIERLLSSSQPSSSLCQLQMIEVSLVCPLSKTKIKLPIRGKHCMHLGCCDASTFLQLVGEKHFSKWKCPICSLPMPYEDIKVDGMLSDIIKGVKKETLKIEFTSSTTWRVKEDKGTSLSSHKLNQSKRKEIIDLTYSPLPNAEGRGSNYDFIDLTNSP